MEQSAIANLVSDTSSLVEEVVIVMIPCECFAAAASIPPLVYTFALLQAGCLLNFIFI